jgi:FixJ family two-component response regulator
MRIVIFTGSDEARDLQRAREVGAAAFVQKAHMSALLLDAIHRAAEKSRPQSKSQQLQAGFQAAVAFG